jgi:hypothetical protein
MLSSYAFRDYLMAKGWKSELMDILIAYKHSEMFKL